MGIHVFPAELVNDLSPAGVTGLAKGQLQTCHIEARDKFALGWEGACADALSPSKQLGKLGYLAAARALNKQWRDLGRKYYLDFQCEIRHLCPDVDGSDQSVAQKFRAPAMREFKKEIWRDLLKAWRELFSRIAYQSAGALFAFPRSEPLGYGDPELAIMEEHDSDLKGYPEFEAAVRIGRGYSILKVPAALMSELCIENKYPTFDERVAFHLQRFRISALAGTSPVTNTGATRATTAAAEATESALNRTGLEAP